MKEKVVIVDWLDSQSYRGWQHQNEGFEPARCRSIGFVVREDKKSLTLTTSRALDNPDVMDPLTIPKGAITRRRKVKYG